MKRLEINTGPAARYSLLVLPVFYLAAALGARSAGGPLWLGLNLDPDYFYLLDALNIVNLTTPGHVYHPGTTVQWLGALILKLAHPLSGAEAVTGHVLADPEGYLGLIGTVFVVLNALAAVALFTLPSAGAWGDMIAYFAKLGLTTGAYGGGEAGFADWGAYPKNFLKLFKRPALHVVLVLSLVVLALTWPRRFDRGAVVVLAALIAAQALAVGNLARELSVTRNLALSIGDDRFPQCARIYSYAASNQSFALFLGDFLTGSRFSIRLAARRPANDYWLEHWWDQSRLVFRGWRGPEDMAAVIGRYPCTVFRSGNWPLIRQLLGKTVSGLTFDATCSTRHETIKTMGVDCDGRTLR